jgi:hypothetical protein
MYDKHGNPCGPKYGKPGVRGPFRRWGALPTIFPESLPAYLNTGSEREAAQKHSRDERSWRRSVISTAPGAVRSSSSGAANSGDDGRDGVDEAVADMTPAAGETDGRAAAPNLTDLEAWLRAASLPLGWAVHMHSDKIVLSELFDDVPVTKYVSRGDGYA